MIGFNNEWLFTTALQLQEPWYIEKVAFTEEQELHMYVAFKKGYKFKIKEDEEETTAYDTIKKTWRHLNFFQYKAYIHCDVPRIKRGSEINMVEVPWSRPNIGFTLLFESFVMALAKVMTVNAISRIVEEHDTRIWRILRYYTEEARDRADYSDVKKIGIDETSVSSHNYITIAVDLGKSRVISITEGKDKTTVDRIASDIVAHGCNVDKIEVATSDMSPAFTAGIEVNFKNAINVYDKFHVIKLINETLDTIRKREVKHNDILKKAKYIFLKNKDNLNPKQAVKLDELLEDEHLQTSIAYKFKLQFQDIYNLMIKRDEAEVRIKSWINNVAKTEIPELKKLARTIGLKLVNILNYFEYRVTNATLEGINSIIQMAKARARGFRNIENFKTIIYLIGAKLDIAVAV